jgi:hypothetical protein
MNTGTSLFFIALLKYGVLPLIVVALVILFYYLKKGGD